MKVKNWKRNQIPGSKIPRNYIDNKKSGNKNRNDLVFSFLHLFVYHWLYVIKAGNRRERKFLCRYEAINFKKGGMI
jgi:predicted dithiol-disulfide oxidoreductase (DUF899 family)